MTKTARALCENCGKRRVVDLFYAMMTQEFISDLCCCHVSPEFVEAAESAPVIVCKKCSRRMQDKQSNGSTQWTFRNSSCSCAVPERYELDSGMVKELVQQLAHQKTKRKERPSKEETEIHVETRK